MNRLYVFLYLDTAESMVYTISTINLNTSELINVQDISSISPMNKIASVSMNDTIGFMAVSGSSDCYFSAYLDFTVDGVDLSTFVYSMNEPGTEYDHRGPSVFYVNYYKEDDQLISQIGKYNLVTQDWTNQSISSSKLEQAISELPEPGAFDIDVPIQVVSIPISFAVLIKSL